MTWFITSPSWLQNSPSSDQGDRSGSGDQWKSLQPLSFVCLMSVWKWSKLNFSGRGQASTVNPWLTDEIQFIVTTLILLLSPLTDWSSYLWLLTVTITEPFNDCWSRNRTPPTDDKLFSELSMILVEHLLGVFRMFIFQIAWISVKDDGTVWDVSALFIYSSTIVSGNSFASHWAVLCRPLVYGSDKRSTVAVINLDLSELHWIKMKVDRGFLQLLMGDPRWPGILKSVCVFVWGRGVKGRSELSAAPSQCM